MTQQDNPPSIESHVGSSSCPAALLSIQFPASGLRKHLKDDPSPSDSAPIVEIRGSS